MTQEQAKKLLQKTVYIDGKPARLERVDSKHGWVRFPRKIRDVPFLLADIQEQP